MIGLAFSQQLAALRQTVRWPDLVVDNVYFFLFRIAISVVSVVSACVQSYLLGSSAGPTPGVFCVFNADRSSFDAEHISFSERCVYQGAFYLPYSTSLHRDPACTKASINYQPYVIDHPDQHVTSGQSPVAYYPFVTLYCLLVWMAVFVPYFFYYGVVRRKLAEFPQPMSFQVPRDQDKQEEQDASLKRAARAIAFCFSRTYRRNGGLFVSYAVYCFSHGLYLLLMVAGTEWYMDRRFLLYGYVTLNDWIRGSVTPLCDPFPLTLGCQVLSSGPSGTRQRHNGVCEYPHNYVNKHIFLAYFVLYHLLLAGFLLNFVYVMCVMVSRHMRWRFLMAKARLKPNRSTLRSSRRRNNVLLLLKPLRFSDWLLLSLIGSNVQVTYFEHVLLAVAHKLRDDQKRAIPSVSCLVDNRHPDDDDDDDDDEDGDHKRHDDDDDDDDGSDAISGFVMRPTQSDL